MKILVVSQDDMFGNAIAIELCENGYDCRYSQRIEGGYQLYVVDGDSIDASKIKLPKVTFSVVEGKHTLTRPFLIKDLVDSVMSASKEDGQSSENTYEHIEFTEKERRLLDLLLEKRGSIVTNEEILQKIWGKEETSSNIVNVYIRYLREKLEGDGDRRIIFTVRGKGYRIE